MPTDWNALRGSRGPAPSPRAERRRPLSPWSKCGEPLTADDRFSSYCGATANSCARCGARLELDDRFCPQCGTGVGADSSANVLSSGQTSTSEGEDPWAQYVTRLRQAT